MKEQPYSLFDRVAVAFGAMILGCGAALAVALPLLLIIGVISSSDLSSVGAALFWKIPVLFGLTSGVVGFISPTIAVTWFEKTWKGVVYVWRGFSGV